MDRRSLCLSASLAAVVAGGLAPAVRADRLGGNYRGPGDHYESRDGGKSGEPEGPGPAEGADPADGGSGDPEGGEYRGPAGEVPVDSRGGEDPPPPESGSGAPTPPDPGSGGSGDSPPSSDPGTGPTSPATPPAADAPATGASPGKGGPADDRDRIWPFYFEGAKEEYIAAALSRLEEPRLSPERTSTWALSLLPETGRRLRTLSEESRSAARDLLLGRLRDADSRVRDAAVIALGKSGNTDAVPFLLQVAARDTDPAVREDALLALGLSGDRAEALPALLQALRAKPRGRGPRTAAYAALGLGLLGDASAAAPLRDLFPAAAANSGRADDAAAAAVALGMLGDPLAIPLFERALATSATPLTVKCAVLHAIGKYGSHADEVVRMEAFAVASARLGARKDLKQSALLALGAFTDAAAVQLLAREGLVDPDPVCRNFAAHSLGRIAARIGPSGREFARVAKELEKASASEVRDRWLFQAGNLALAAMAAADRERPLLGMLEEASSLNLHSASSAALALGLHGPASPEVAHRLRATFEGRAVAAPVRAYAGLALALSGSPGSAAALARVLSAEERPPAEVARTAALGLGLAGGAEGAEILVGVLERSGATEGADPDRFFVLGAAVQGLGLLGDEAVVERLRPLTTDASWTRRAFATAALGYLVENDPGRRAAPRLSEIFRHHNYRMPLPVIRAVQSTL